MNPTTKFTLTLGQDLIVKGYNNQSHNIPSGLELDVTNSVSSWSTIDITNQRNGLSGTLTSMMQDVIINQTARYSSDITPYLILKTLFENYGLFSKAKLKIYLRDNINLDVYTLEKEIDLDFREYQWAYNMVQLIGTSPELQEMINAKGGNKFDIPVNEIKENKKFQHTPMAIESSARFILPEDTPITIFSSGNSFIYSLEVPFMEIETIPDRSLIECRSQPGKQINKPSDEFFIYSHGNATINFKAKFEMDLSTTIKDRTVQVIKTKEDGTEEILYSNPYPESNPRRVFDIDLSISLNYGDKLSFILTATRRNQPPYRFIYKKFEYFNIYWKQDTGNDRPVFNVFKPERLLQALLDKLNPGAYTSSIEWKNMFDYLSLLCAADSIRNISEQIVHTSINEFIKWAQVKGYSYKITGNHIEFRKRGDYYKKEAISMNLKKGEVSNLRISTNKEYTFTAVKIGYEKQNYDNVNGRYEVNGLFEYTTGIPGEENILDLISPYRADLYGVEFLSWDNFARSKDNKSDNDIFELASVELSDYYVIYKDVFYNIINENGLYVTGLFNGALSPYYLMLENESTIGITTTLAEFTASSNNRNVKLWKTVGGSEYVETNSDIPITKKLFDPIVYYFDVGIYQNLPIEKDGLVHFEYKDEKYKGYIFELNKNYSKNKKEEWILYAVKN